MTFPNTYYSPSCGEYHANLRGQATNGNRMTNPSVSPEAKCQLLESPLQGNCAPRYAMLDSWCSQERFGGKPLGHLIDLKAKAGGDKSMSEKQEVSEDAYDAALQGPRDTAKARLPEPQSPAVQAAHPSPQRLWAMLPGATRSTFAARTLCLAGDR